MNDQLCFHYLQFAIEVDRRLEEPEDCERRTKESLIHQKEASQVVLFGSSATVQSISESHDVRSTCPMATSWRLLVHLDSGWYAIYLIPF